ncbi:hypothetical protein AB3331_04825 [Streptococcus sp. H49]|uniref:hypothetical protein n=1 Tax=Streptococcus huangxiaojuni TaxID=3237239 RepID=UPI0034A15267
MKKLNKAGLEADYLKLIEETNDFETSYRGGFAPYKNITGNWICRTVIAVRR